MPTIPAVRRFLLPAVVLATVTGCGTLSSGRWPLLSSFAGRSSKRTPSGSRDADPFPHRRHDVDSNTWADERGRTRGARGDSDATESLRLAELNRMIDREVPKIDPEKRRFLLAKVRDQSLRDAAYTIRLLGGQIKLEQISRDSRNSSRRRDVPPFGRNDSSDTPEIRGDQGVRHSGHSRDRRDFRPDRDTFPDSRPGGSTQGSGDHRAFRRDNESRDSDEYRPGRSTPSGNRENERDGIGTRILKSVGLGTARNRPPNGRAGDGLEQADWNKTLQRLILLTEEKTAHRGGPGDDQLSPRSRMTRTREQVYLRMLYLISGQQQLAMEVAGFEPDEREFWQAALTGISNYLEGGSKVDRGDRASRAVNDFRTAVRQLSDMADLEIQNLNFCSNITGYGNYEILDRPVFRAGQQALIYAEIENFKSKLVARGRRHVYQTKINSTITIDSAENGNFPTKTIKFNTTTDICIQRRRDYFHSYVIDIPKTLTPGNYTLKLTVLDVQGDKVKTERLNFQVD